MGIFWIAHIKWMVWHLDVGLSFPKSVGSLIGGSAYPVMSSGGIKNRIQITIVLVIIFSRYWSKSIIRWFSTLLKDYYPDLCIVLSLSCGFKSNYLIDQVLNSCFWMDFKSDVNIIAPIWMAARFSKYFPSCWSVFFKLDFQLKWKPLEMNGPQFRKRAFFTSIFNFTQAFNSQL